MPVLTANPNSIARATAALRAGQVVAFPTETVYGLGALCTQDTAINALYTQKGRAANVPLQLLAPNLGIAHTYVQLNTAARRLANHFWPGALTMVLPRKPAAPISPRMNIVNDTLGLRIPDHPVIQALLHGLQQPLAASSANLSGQPAPRTAEEVARYFPGDDLLILDDGEVPLGTASTVIDLTAPQPKLLREGSIPFAEILKVLGIKG